MIISRVARRYAEAIYADIPADPGPEAFFTDCAAMRAMLASSRELHLFFQSPIVPAATKRAVVEELSIGRFGAYMRQVLLFLLEKGREKLVDQVLAAIDDIRRAKLGIHTATVASARPLSDEQRVTLDKALAALSHGSVESTYAVDPSLIGGVVARVGDTVFDGTVVRQLARLRTRFAAGM